MTTMPNEADARAMAEKIVESRLAGCVQILPQMTSVYLWKGNVCRDPEYLLLIKTLEEKYDQLEAFIRANHGYEIPEVVALNAVSVSGDYHGWLRECLN